MSKVRKTVTLSSETVDKVTKLAEQESRSFSQMLDILVNQSIKSQQNQDNRRKI
jgi:predicted transcriptional regulator